MLVTKKRLYTELCKVMDTVHEIITCVELEKHHRKADVEDIKLAIEPMHAHLIHLENRVAALEAKKYHKAKTTKKKGK